MEGGGDVDSALLFKIRLFLFVHHQIDEIVLLFFGHGSDLGDQIFRQKFPRGKRGHLLVRAISCQVSSFSAFESCPLSHEATSFFDRHAVYIHCIRVSRLSVSRGPSSVSAGVPCCPACLTSQGQSHSVIGVILDGFRDPFFNRLWNYFSKEDSSRKCGAESISK